MYELSNEVLISRVSNASGAATTGSVTTSVLDMQGFDAVAFVCLMGGNVTDGSIITLTPKENSFNATTGSPATITSGATVALTASGNSNNVLVSDCIRPSSRYVYAVLSKTTQTANVDAILAFQYRAKSVPVTQPATVVAQKLSSPEV